jgi:hypothetical protein
LKNSQDFNQSDKNREINLSHNMLDTCYQFKDKGFNLNSNEQTQNSSSILEKLRAEKEEAEKKLNQAIIDLNTSNKEIRSYKIIINDLKHEKRDIEIKVNQILKKLELYQNIEADFYEASYHANVNRSFIQRLISKFPSSYLILSGKNIGLKNVLLNIKGYKVIKRNKLFDMGYYLANNEDVRISGKDPLLHYICIGYKESRNPSSKFDGEKYLKTHEDVKNLNINPLVHYCVHGIIEGREIIESNK